METMYLEDLANATEVVVGEHPAVPRRSGRNDQPAPRDEGSAGRAAAGLLRISNTVGAAVANRRVLEPVEVRIMLAVAIVLLVVGVPVALFPRVLAYPFAAVTVWLAASLLYRSYRLHQRGRREQGGRTSCSPEKGA